MIQDVYLFCRDCSQQFLFTRAEQMFYASRNIINPPSRCPSCRAEKKTRRTEEQSVKDAQRTEEASKTQWLTCLGCGNQFAFTYGEQQYYASKGFSTPSRCKSCRTQRKADPTTQSNGTGQSRQLYAAICADCGAETQLPFQPKPGRPVYCRSCYPAHKNS